MENSNNSFVSVLKRGSQSHVTPEITKPALVLDDTCIKEFDFGMSLMGRAKDVSAIPNLPCIISKEGFQNVKLSYLGGMWVLFEFDSLTAKEKFLNHSGIGSWFTELIQATSSFENDERIVWISIEGLPIKAWTPNTFRKIASLWGEYVEWEDDDLKSLSCKHLCLKTNMKVIINERQKVIIQGKVYWIRVKELDAWFPNFQEDDQDDLSSDGESQEGDVANKADNNESDVDRVSESSFMHENDIAHKDANSGKKGEVGSHSEDPFNIYGILDGQKNNPWNKAKRRRIKGYVRSIDIKFASIQETKAEAGAMLLTIFISSACLIVLPLEGYAFTWAHKSALKMSKLDRYLISEGPSPCRFFHSGFAIEGFNFFCGKLPGAYNKELPWRFLKKPNRWSLKVMKTQIFHGIMNKKVIPNSALWDLANGEWISEPHKVKNEFFTHFKKQFLPIQAPSICFDFTFPTRLSSDQVQDWRFLPRLSKWKLKLLSIGGRLTLLKSVLTSIPLYHMSIFKVPIGVLNHLESIRQNFFYGVDGSDRKLAWIGWNMVLTSKKNGGLGEGCDEVLYKRLYALEMCKSISVAEKMGHPSLSHSFRRMPRGGVEQENYGLLCSKVDWFCVPTYIRKMVWSLRRLTMRFSVKSSRILIDNTILSKAEVLTRWLESFPSRYLLRGVVVNLALQKSIALWEFSTKACFLIR
ncbi:RNA-directed DNA polymerase, eukaryota [Tanacetum coccineum]